MADFEKPAQQRPSAVFALKAKCAEISGTIARLHRQIARRRADLMRIDCAIRLLDPALTAIETRARVIRFSDVGHLEKVSDTANLH
jgi:hypothetical protein